MRTALLIAGISIVGYLIYRTLQNNTGGGIDLTGVFGTGAGSDATGGGDSAAMATGDNTQGNSVTDLLSKWANAIFHHEGGNAGNRNVRNNNPGNLVYAGQAGAIGKDSAGFAIFPDMQTGMAALERDLTAKVNKYPNYSILQIMARYLGNADPMNVPANGEIYVNGKYQGNANDYAKTVAKALGVSTSATLSEIFG